MNRPVVQFSPAQADNIRRKGKIDVIEKKQTKNKERIKQQKKKEKITISL